MAGLRRRADARGRLGLREEGIEPLELDVTDAAQIASAAVVVGADLHGLVNNAGIAIAAPLELVPVDELRRQLDVNVVGQVAVTRRLLPRSGEGAAASCSWVDRRSQRAPFLGPYAASEACARGARGLAAGGVGRGDGGLDRRAGQHQDCDLAEGRDARGRAPRGAPAGGADLYETSIARFREVALARGPGADPDLVARAVEHALTSGRPKPRYVVGRDAHVRAWIERLPTRLRDCVLARVLTG